MLHEVVLNGTGAVAVKLHFPVAGKTGGSQHPTTGPARVFGGWLLLSLLSLSAGVPGWLQA